MSKKTVIIGIVLIGLLACLMLPFVSADSNWDISYDWGGTIVNVTTNASIIDVPQLIILIVFLVFTTLAFQKQEPFAYAVAGLIGIILGAMFAIAYIGDQVTLWMYGILGIALVLFGLWMLIASVLKNAEAK